MRRSRYIDFSLIEKYPNKYNLSTKSIKKLKIKDWDRLKKKTWYNEAMKKTGTWWCHLEGCQSDDNKKYDDENEFWIGFREDDDTIDYRFSSYEGMCGYVFDEFYKIEDIENKYDMNVQANAIKWLNMMIDEGILEQST